MMLGTPTAQNSPSAYSVTVWAVLPCCQLRSCIFLHSEIWLKYTKHVVRCVCVCVCARACVRACARARARARVCVCVCVYVCGSTVLSVFLVTTVFWSNQLPAPLTIKFNIKTACLPKTLPTTNKSAQDHQRHGRDSQQIHSEVNGTGIASAKTWPCTNPATSVLPVCHSPPHKTALQDCASVSC